jgi:hypothetical protein
LVIFGSKRPLAQTIKLVVQNPLHQEWQFKLDLNVELGKSRNPYSSAFNVTFAFNSTPGPSPTLATVSGISR